MDPETGKQNPGGKTTVRRNESTDLWETDKSETSTETENTASAKETVRTGTWETAAQTPYGAYPELVTYTLGQMSGTNNSNLPDGNTYEDNAYTRYLRKMLNFSLLFAIFLRLMVFDEGIDEFS